MPRKCTIYLDPRLKWLCVIIIWPYALIRYELTETLTLIPTSNRLNHGLQITSHVQIEVQSQKCKPANLAVQLWCMICQRELWITCDVLVTERHTNSRKTLFSQRFVLFWMIEHFAFALDTREWAPYEHFIKNKYNINKPLNLESAQNALSPTLEFSSYLSNLLSSPVRSGTLSDRPAPMTKTNDIQVIFFVLLCGVVIPRLHLGQLKLLSQCVDGVSCVSLLSGGH